MLARLSIRNYALIEELEISFADKLNIITGETGAGKSILLGALNLVLGERADNSILNSSGEKCVVEASFKNFFERDFGVVFSKNDLPYEDEMILRREIYTGGKSRAFVNDSPVTLNILKEIAERLIDFTTQNEKQILLRTSEQLNVLDEFGGLLKLREEYKKFFEETRVLENEIAQLKNHQNDLQQKLDFLSFQLKELQEANLQEGELENLEAERKVLENANLIAENIYIARQQLYENENSAYEQIARSANLIDKISSFNPQIAEVSQQIQNLKFSVKNADEILSGILNSINLDPKRMEFVEERISTYYSLMKKHRVQKTEELIRLREELSEKVSSIETSDEKISLLEEKLSENKNILSQKANALSEKRKKTALTLSKKIISLLREVGIAYPQFMIDINQREELSSWGKDEIEFLISTNKGVEPAPLHRIASGGEISRVMLAVKSALAGEFGTHTIIFDEIDTGVSGEVALRVGKVMESLAQNHQVLCITHIPQIASRGKSHYMVFKKVENNKTATQIKKLSERERVFEIAKLISGEKPAVSAQKTAEQLINN